MDTGANFPIDKHGFEELFRTHFPGLCAFAAKYIRDFDASKDIVHDVFINFWNKREEMDPKKSVKSYLFTSVYNRCMNYIRDHKKFDANEAEPERMERHAGYEDSDQLEQAELEERINRILNDLPEKCRQIFVMNRFEGLK